MRTVAQKPKANQQATSPRTTLSGQARFSGNCEVNSILHLQRTIGNQAVQRILLANAEELKGRSTATTPPPVGHDFSSMPAHPSTEAKQTKLAINTPGDGYEQEADRIADQVMRMPEAQLQRDCPCSAGCVCGERQGDRERLQAKHDRTEREAPPVVDEILRSTGHMLDSATRAFMEPRFGHDFSQVRIHRDSRAMESAQKISAKAYTVGQNIVFGAGQYAPETTEGKRLLAHELAHTLQQSKGSPARSAIIQRAVSIAEPYSVIDDFDPAAQAKQGNRALGRTDPFLNFNPQVPNLHRDTFLRALNPPTLARRNLDKIPKPDLSDPVLDPVRDRTALIFYGHWNSKRVKLVQEALMAWGRGLDTPVQMLPAFGADGNFKNETLSAVKNFQQKSSVAVDGIVGHETLGALQQAMDDLRGSVFSLDTVGRNDFQGLIHIPPPSKSWTRLNTDQDFIFDKFVPENSGKDLERAQLANHFAKCPRDNQQVQIVFTDPGGNAPAEILKHEKHHETDQLKTLKTHLVPWDAALESFNTTGRSFRAQNPQEATAQIFAGANLRTPCELSTDIVQEWIADNVSFHSTLAGGEMTQKLESLTCTRLTFSLRPPTSVRQITVPARPKCASPGQALPVSRDIEV